MISETQAHTRRPVFIAITLAIPVAFLVFVELGLRLVGFGDSLPLFIPVAEAPDYLHANPRVVRRFIVIQSKVPAVAIHPVAFPAHKGADSFRIVVQGGSTAAGYPYGYGASLAGMLQQRLQQTFPERDIDVITTAMTAVNSYTLADFAGEIIAQQPDAVLIYAGHNEYLGFLGVGSTFSAGRSRSIVLTWLYLRELRIVQLMQHAWQALTNRDAGEREQQKSERTLMARVVHEPHIPLDSPLYRRGLEQFRANLSALLERYQEAGIPVFVGTVASNERDQPPFVGVPGSATDERRWRQLYESGRAASRMRRPEEAETALRAAIALDDTAADAWFALGGVLEKQDRYEEARSAFLAAKDRDQLRFRAPEAINAVIREVAARYGATVVEVQDALVGASRHGSVGEDLMLEHLHPNLRGYFLLATAYYDAMRAAGLIGTWELPVSDEAAWQDIPVTEVDRLNARYQILRLKSDWPYVREPRRPDIPLPSEYTEKLAYKLFSGKQSWDVAMRKLYDHLRLKHDDRETARVALLLAGVFPYDISLQVNAASYAIRAGRKAEAAAVLRRAARAQVASGDRAGAHDSLQRLLEISPADPAGRRLLDNLGGIQEYAPEDSGALASSPSRRAPPE